MIFLGHIASALMASRLPGVDRRMALAGALFPDLLDKSLHWVLGATPSDRLWGHTLWSVLGSTVAVGALCRAVGRRNGTRSWLWGYAVHLLGDVTAPIPLLYPLSTRGVYRGARMREMLAGERCFPWRVAASEVLLLLAAVALERHVRWNGSGTHDQAMENMP
ncbi:MAG: metal-dependent hydrolase [Chloroflexi bacterium]|nr:metal-dependent hydrolase [Chloroflexota bacterium]